jgi:hypothetical protein
MRPSSRWIGFVGASALLLSGCLPGYGPLTVRGSFEETRPLDPEGHFTVENVNGEVTVASWDRSLVRIEAELRATSQAQLEAIEIDVDGTGDRVEVRTRLPRGGLFGGGSGAVSYHITLPRHARIGVETVNGRVKIEGVAGKVVASTVNGAVEIADASGQVRASTVNGSIKTEYHAADPEGHHRFETTNGSVTVMLPEHVSGRFSARTVNGSISTDFPLAVEGKLFNKRLEGRLGDGRGSYEISTVNGAVRIRKS